MNIKKNVFLWCFLYMKVAFIRQAEGKKRRQAGREAGRQKEIEEMRIIRWCIWHKEKIFPNNYRSKFASPSGKIYWSNLWFTVGLEIKCNYATCSRRWNGGKLALDNITSDCFDTVPGALSFGESAKHIYFSMQRHLRIHPCLHQWRFLMKVIWRIQMMGTKPSSQWRRPWSFPCSRIAPQPPWGPFLIVENFKNSHCTFSLWVKCANLTWVQDCFIFPTLKCYEAVIFFKHDIKTVFQIII